MSDNADSAPPPAPDAPSLTPSAPTPPSASKYEGTPKVNVLLALLGIALCASMSLLFFRDVARTVKPGVATHDADDIAIRALQQLTPQNGWFQFVRNPLFDFENDAQGWAMQDEIGIPDAITRSDDAPPALQPAKPSSAGSLELAETNLPTHGRALAIPVDFPNPVTIIRETSRGTDDPYKMMGIRFISYDVYVPKECPGYVSSILFLKDKDGLWYQARSRAALVPGRWTTVTADLRGNSPDITPLGHQGQWDDNQATRVRSVGITIYGNMEWKGEKVFLDNFRGWTRHDRLKSLLNSAATSSVPPDPAHLAELQKQLPEAEKFKDSALKVLNFRTEPPAHVAEDGTGSAPSVRRYDMFTLRFELNRAVENPFDPEKADITCAVTAPSGEVSQHIGFWYQDYDRSDRFENETLNPIGRPEWRVRISPREVGEYKYQLKVRTKRLGAPEGEMDEIVLAPRTFTALPSDTKGFIRVSQKDPRYFEHETGEFYFPVGHNVSSPVDIRCWREVIKEEPPAGRGLPMYQDFLGKMHANGANMCEVWMASWWLGIEWTSRWPHFYGAGRYSLQNAWKLDYTLEMARKHGIYIHVVFDNHGKFSAWCDWEWELNPYNANNPFDRGTASTAEEMFTDAQARKWHQHKLRYIAARWGADTTVMGWEMVSEYDLVGGQHQQDRAARVRFHRSPVLRAWAQEMMEYVKNVDPYKHPVTMHYATDYTIVDTELVQKPFVDYVATDVYRPISRRYSQAAVMNQEWFRTNLHAAGVTKPFWITEYGGDFNAAPLPNLHADIVCGMWSTWMTEHGGTPLFWWFDLIDRLDAYGYYGAFNKYIKGEDKRGLKGNTINLQITANQGGTLIGQMYQWQDGAYGWIYNDRAMMSLPVNLDARPIHDGVEAIVNALPADTYRVEYWDCYTGEIVKSEDVVVAANQPLLMKFPRFAANMAYKIKSATKTPNLPPLVQAPATPPTPTPAVKKKTKFITPDRAE